MPNAKQKNYENDLRKLEICKVDLMGRRLPTEALGRLDQTEDDSHVDHERGDGEIHTEGMKAVLLDFAPSTDLERRHQHNENAHGKDLICHPGQEDVVWRGGILTSRIFHAD